MNCTINKLQIAGMLDDPSPIGIIVRGQNTLTIPTQILIENCDFGSLSSNKQVVFVDPSNATKVRISSQA
jgi:hypothetical protein